LGRTIALLVSSGFWYGTLSIIADKSSSENNIGVELSNIMGE
jgi:hypothetical protein